MDDFVEVAKAIDKLTSRLNRARRKRRLRETQRKRAIRKSRWDLSKHHFKKGDHNRTYGDRKYNDGALKMDTTEIDCTLDENNKEFFLAATSLNDHFISKLIDIRTQAGLNTHNEEFEFICTGDDWMTHVSSIDIDWQKIEFGSLAGMVVHDKTKNFIDYTITSNSTTVKLYGDRTFIERTREELLSKFKIATCHIEWVYSGDGSSINIPLLGDKLPVSEMYPFLEDETIESYYDRYFDSSASILLLIGPPGTGKTTFIRGLLHHLQKNAMVTYDEKILEKDFIFARFIEDDCAAMVVEDADNFLKSRRDGNTMMHRFLNVGDGLITMKGKKLIFSTNLPSINDVDPALTRPGRCFDIIHFDNYTPEQAKRLAKKMNIDFTPDGKDKKYSLAEIFHQQRMAVPKSVTPKFGFI